MHLKGKPLYLLRKTIIILWSIVCVVRGEPPTSLWWSWWRGRACVNHACKNNGRVSRRAAEVRSLGVWGEDRSPGADGGTDSTDLGHGVLSVPLLPGAALSSPARSFPSTEMWLVALMESRGLSPSLPGPWARHWCWGWRSHLAQSQLPSHCSAWAGSSLWGVGGAESQRVFQQ